jgi:uncharacterized protein (DUF1330 family)
MTHLPFTVVNHANGVYIFKRRRVEELIPEQIRGSLEDFSMAAYLIGDVKLKDVEAYKPYQAGVPEIIRKHGGEYLVRGGSYEVKEGAWKPVRIVVIQFPDWVAAQAFLDDPEYQPMKAIRHRVAQTDLVLVDGV